MVLCGGGTYCPIGWEPFHCLNTSLGNTILNRVSSKNLKVLFLIRKLLFEYVLSLNNFFSLKLTSFLAPFSNLLCAFQIGRAGIYEQICKCPTYFWYKKNPKEMEPFALVLGLCSGMKYLPGDIFTCCMSLVGDAVNLMEISFLTLKCY